MEPTSPNPSSLSFYFDCGIQMDRGRMYAELDAAGDLLGFVGPWRDPPPRLWANELSPLVEETLAEFRARVVAAASEQGSVPGSAVHPSTEIAMRELDVLHHLRLTGRPPAGTRFAKVVHQLEGTAAEWADDDTDRGNIVWSGQEDPTMADLRQLYDRNALMIVPDGDGWSLTNVTYLPVDDAGAPRLLRPEDAGGVPARAVVSWDELTSMMGHQQRAT